MTLGVLDVLKFQNVSTVVRNIQVVEEIFAKCDVQDVRI